MCGAIVTAPFDLVKTRLQSDLFKSTSSASANSVAHKTRSGIRGLLWNFADTGLILRDVWKYEGPSALFKGLGPTLVGVVPGRSINFFVYGNGKHLYAELFNGGRENAAVHLSAAATAGVVTAAATNPIWVVKTLLQLQQQERSSPSSPSSSSTVSSSLKRPPVPIPAPPRGTVPTSTFSHSFRSLTSPPAALSTPPGRPTSYSTIISIYRRDGIPGFYRGLSASLLGVTEGTIQWGLYEQFKIVAKQGVREDEEPAWWRNTVAAGAAKLVATVITYPHEVIRTRLRQPIPPGFSGPKYVGLVQSFKLVLKEEGPRALYGGMSPHLLRVVPNACTMFFVYEKIISLSLKVEKGRLERGD
ncbi:mitochondrial carrier [Meredithblackwellia eburnea MCA 4105]